MPATSTHEPLTTKQAKAAYKARGGQSSISDAEKKRLARGAELLKRAEQTKLREKRKKSFLKTKEDQERDDAKEVVKLGTQVRLDRYGHKSSQFHLGNFLRKKPSPVSIAAADLPKIEDSDSYDQDELDDALLSEAGDGQILEKVLRTGSAPFSAVPQSAPTMDLVDDFFLSNTQLSREISASPEPAPAKTAPAPVNFPQQQSTSFSSDDFGFTEDDFDTLERRLEATTAEPVLIKPEVVESKADIERTAMPPPSFRPSEFKTRIPLTAVDSCMSYSHGLSKSDLESMANEDVVFTQYDGS